MTEAEVEQRLAELRAGRPIKYSYSAYGVGQVRIFVTFDARNGQYEEEREDHDMDGSVMTMRSVIDEEVAARHARGEREG